MRGGLAASLLALVSGCGLAPTGGQRALVAADAAVTFDEATGTLALSLDGEERLVFPASAFELGVVDAVDDETNYDPYRLYAPYGLWSEPAGLRFAPALSARLAEETESSLELDLDHGAAGRSTLALSRSADGRFAARWTPEGAGAPGPGVAFFRLAPRIDADEGLYGLGEVFDHVNHRGAVRAMQIEADGSIESSYNEAHVPIPLLLGTRGWGLFVESPYPGAFDLGSRQPTRVEAAFGTGPASGEGLLFHLFAEAAPLDLTRHYYAITGAPRLPAPWALGPWLWRDENTDQAQVLSDLAAIRSNDLANTGYWIDRPYATAIQTFDFEAARFPDPSAIFAELGALGMKGALWHVPYLDEGDPAATALYAEATQASLYPPDTGLLLNKWGKPIDLTNEEAVLWWQSKLRAYTDLGVGGFKLDYGEDVLVGPTDKRERWAFANGADERTMHHGFPIAYHRAYAELFEEGAFLLCRAGSYGDQAQGCVIWPGDLDASFARHREEVTDGADSYVAVGGLPASLVAALSLGPSGFAFYGSDTGGYRHSPPDAELFVRWAEQTALSSVMQVGNSANTVPWEADPATGFDALTLDVYRRAARLHLRLFPYLWAHASRLGETGRPLMRPFGLAYPESGEHPDDVYLLGDALLVGAVTERGALEKTLPIPPGEWVEVATGVRALGPTTLTVPAPLERLPLFLRAGWLVPRLRPTIDTLLHATAPGIDSDADDPSELWIWAALPSGDDVGEPFETHDGATLRLSRAGGRVELWALGASRPPVFELVGVPSPPLSVQVDGASAPEVADDDGLRAVSAGWRWSEEAGGTLFVRLGVSATVELG